MTFLHVSLLAGLTAMAVPLMIHLLGQRQPKMETFPALRFVRQTAIQQRRSWRLRHLLLLLLRMAILGALAFALARPRIHSAMLSSVLTISTLGIAAAFAGLVAVIAWVGRRPTAVWATSGLVAFGLLVAAVVWGSISFASGPIVPKSDRSAPVAAAVIVDVGPGMSYRADNASRLESAQQMADWILDQMPPDSRVGIFAGAPAAALSLDPAAARSQLQQLQPRGKHVDLPGQLRTALNLLVANQLERKEIYVITDLSANSWTASQGDLKELLSQHRDNILLQIIDLGGSNPMNWRLGDIGVESQSVPVGATVSFEVKVARTDEAVQGTATVELIQETIDPKLPILRNGRLDVPASSVVDKQFADLTIESSTTIRLSTKELKEPGTYNFRIRLDQPDPLELDNVRYATIVAESQQPTLVVADDPAAATHFSFIIDPTGELSRETPELIERIKFAQLAVTDLGRFAAICLVDPPELSSATVDKLRQRVEAGTGLLITLGRQLTNVENAAMTPINELLPGKLQRVVVQPADDRSQFLVPAMPGHPVFFPLGAVAAETHWHLFPIFRSWNFATLNDRAQILMTYSQSAQPALVHEFRGKGRVITFTTPLPEFDRLDQPLWNELTIGDDQWPAFALLYGCIRTIGGSAQARYNFTVGEAAQLVNDPLNWPSSYVYFSPDAKSRRIEAENGIIKLGSVDQSGTYRMRGQRTGPVSRSISANIASSDSDLTRITPEGLEQFLGAGNYRVAKNRDEVQSSVGQARFGQELYSMLMIVIAGVFLAEQAMSNRFYKIKFGAA